MAENNVEDEYLPYLESISETDRVDYKLKFSDDVEAIGKTVKVFAAMANSGGGLVIYGVDEKGPQYVGIDADQVKRLNPANLGSTLSKYLSPVPTFITVFKEFKNANFGIVKIEGITEVPILIGKNIVDTAGRVSIKSGALFVRSLTRSIEASSENQVRPVLDRVITFQVRRQLADWSNIFGVGSKPTEPPNKKSDELRSISRKHVPFTDAIAIREAIYKGPMGAKPLSDAQMRSLIDIRAKFVGLVWPIYGARGENAGHGKSENGYMAYYNDVRMYFARVQSDVIFSTSSLIEDEHALSGHNGAAKFKNAIGVGLTINLVTVACVLGWKYLELAGWSDIDLEYSLRNINGRQLVVEDFNRMSFRNSYVAIDTNVSATIRLLPSSREEKVVKIRELLTEIFSYFLWTPEPTQLEKDIEKTLSGTHIESHVLGIN